jgi:hypothetical protein
LTLVPTAALNYVFAIPVHGTLIVNPAAQVINFNPVATSQSYGQFITLTAAASSGLPVTFTTTGPAIFYNNVNNILELNGIGTVTATATQMGNSNYLAAASVTQTINVAPAPLQVVANSFTREQGASNPTLYLPDRLPFGLSRPMLAAQRFRYSERDYRGPQCDGNRDKFLLTRNLSHCDQPGNSERSELRVCVL